jgi:hypothetical protein
MNDEIRMKNDETNALRMGGYSGHDAFRFVIRISVIRHSFGDSSFVIRHFRLGAILPGIRYNLRK